MCGITGFLDLNFSSSDYDAEGAVRSMTARLTHRGPDSAGLWHDMAAGIAIGHRRLSIVDLSPNGHQPMFDSTGRFALVYNGEIYNANEMRSALEAKGVTFRGHSDTEVLLEACRLWGVTEATQRSNGMFAFALWDRQERTLCLVRDRFGIKPLYWAQFNHLFIFGSEIKALKAHPLWRQEIEKDALYSYLQLNYVPAPLSIYKNVHKLLPGHMLTINPAGQYTEEVYWDLHTIAQQPSSYALGEQDAIEALDKLLRDAVNRCMVADVPLGAFLSGGIDSSVVASLMQAQSNVPIQTFSIGFKENEYNEAPYAAAIARHLGTNHHELYLDSSDALSLIPHLPQWYDEPFADSSQIPTYLVSKLARQHVTVSLSGDGGDEVFAGYNRYFIGKKLNDKLRLLPSPVRSLLFRIIHSFSPQTWSSFARLLPASYRPSQLGDKLYKAANFLASGNANAIYERLITLWDESAPLLTPLPHNPALFPSGLLSNPPSSFVEYMQYVDTLTYLPEDILTKVDRASMAVSLEARVPLLDHRVIEFAWSLPQSMKIRHNKGKWLLRQVLKQYIPETLYERPKMGFGIPLEHWLRNDLRPWAEDLLQEQRLVAAGLNPAPIRKRWQEHLSGQRNWQYVIWNILMYQAWHEKI